MCPSNQGFGKLLQGERSSLTNRLLRHEQTKLFTFLVKTMSKIFTPVNQTRLTNVAVVRMKRGGKRFEIACYRNKVVSWREGFEKNIDEVLQTDTVFANVSKGEVANKNDLKKAFSTTDASEICKMILEKGELQVSDRERAAQQDSKWKDIAKIVSQQCVNPDSKKPYPVTVIEKAMKDVHFSVNPTKGAKQQALELIKKLKTTMKIERSQMRIYLTISGKDGKRIKERGGNLFATIEDEFSNQSFCITALIDPGNFRVLNDLLTADFKGKARIEIMDVMIQKVGDEEII